MRVLIIHTAYWSHYKAKVYSELYRQATEQGSVTLKVVHLAAIERSRAGLGQPNAQLHQYPHEVLHDGFFEDTAPRTRLKQLLQQVKQVKPDVVVTPGYFDPAVILLTAYCKLRGIRIIMAIDSTESDNARAGVREWLKRRIVSMASGFFCYGERSAQYMIRLGASPAQILSKKNAVDNQAMRQLHEQAITRRPAELTQRGWPAHNFIYVGRIIDQLKNLSTLINAYAEARKQTQANWGLIILGDGTDTDRLKAQVAQAQIPDVAFVAGQSWDTVPAYLALADVLVLPSYSEPWGLVVNEAMACGLPVVVSDRCGCADDLVQGNGYVFNPYQPAQLTNALLPFMTGQANYAAMSQESARLIAAYTPAAVARDMLAGFRQVWA